MTQRNHNDFNFEDAIASFRRQEPPEAETNAAGARVWQRVQQEIAAGHAKDGVPHISAGNVGDGIRSCDDIRALLPAYRDGSLATARALLVQDHLRECIACRNVWHGDTVAQQGTTPWHGNVTPMRPRWGLRLPQFAMAAAIVLVVGLSGYFAQRVFFAPPVGPRATVQSVEGPVYLVAMNGERPLAVGGRVNEGESLRTAPGGHAFVRLIDGSVVEVNERSEMSVTAGHKDTTIHLDGGKIIVQAAHRTSGHLYVDSRDCRVAVTGTIFAVDSGTKGSRVAVVEGEVHVEQGGKDSVLHHGELVATSASMGTVPVQQEIAWSQNLTQYLALLAQFSTLQQKFEQIPSPALRFDSQILPLVPANTVVYASIPNLGEALAQANAIFQQQMQESDVLRQWWNQQNQNARPNEPTLQENIDRIRTVSQYLGNEVVFVVTAHDTASGAHGSPVLLANVKDDAGLRSFFEGEVQRMAANAASGQGPQIRILDQATLASLNPTAPNQQMLVLLQPGIMAVAGDVGSLQRAEIQLLAGPSGFDQTPFGQRVRGAYNRGAGMLIAADLQSITNQGQARTAQQQAHLNSVGAQNIRYLLIERREVNNQADNRAVLDFNGPRQGVASWLAAPAPMRSLQYVSSDASMSFSFVAKSPTLMLQDVLNLFQGNTNAQDHIAEAEQELGISFKDDLAATVGSDVTFALDGAPLPTPSWKIVAEVYDPLRLQSSLQKIVAAYNQRAAARNRPSLDLSQQQVGDQTYYVVTSTGPGVVNEIDYTFVDGFMIIAPSRALLMKAIQVKENGTSLGDSVSFRNMLPHDDHNNFSALLYQNLSPVLTPLAGALTGEQMQYLKQIAQDNKPTVVAAYGDTDKIEVVATSRFFGFDLNSLTLSALLGARNRGTPTTANP